MAEPVIDTSKTMQIGNSPVSMLMLVGLGFGFVVMGLVLTRIGDELFIHLLGYVTIAFFGLAMAVLLWRLITQRGPVITLSPEGLRDIRVSPDTIPWPAVASLSTWAYSGQRAMIVALHPGEEEKLQLTRMARMTRSANASLGADGLAVATQGTRIGHDALMAATIAYARAHALPAV